MTSHNIKQDWSICISKDPEEELEEARPEPHLKLHNLGVQMPLKLQGQLRQLKHSYLHSNDSLFRQTLAHLPCIPSHRHEGP